MYPSTEARWFFQDREDISLFEKWFSSFGLSLDQQETCRTDYYLSIAGCKNLGLKIRDPQHTMMGKWIGKLEAKILVKDIGHLKMKNGSSGFANEWIKFSFNLPAGEDELEKIIQAHSDKQPAAITRHWIKLEKKRLLVTYDMSHKKFIKEQAQVEEGCGIELTVINMNDQLFYSIALEGYSFSGKHEANFFETLNTLFSEVEGLELSDQYSYTYPGFLQAHV